jgi:hypothetical protein
VVLVVQLVWLVQQVLLAWLVYLELVAQMERLD